MLPRISSRCIRPVFRLPPRRGITTSTTSSGTSSFRAVATTTAVIVSSGLFAFYYLDARSAIHRYFFTPVLRYAVDAETGHKIAVKVLATGLGPRDPLEDDERLAVELWGQKISNPVGLAAGFDKNGEAIDGLFNLGFSWVEIGSVTPKPQPGNPQPRVFHLPSDDALINRYGFPSEGGTAVLARLKARANNWWKRYSNNLDLAAATPAAHEPGRILAVNLGKNKSSPADSSEDFVSGIRMFGPHADVLVVNVSSPNTPGLRGLQNKDSLTSLLKDITSARDDLNQVSKPRLLLKIAPDLDDSQLADVAEVVKASSIDGVIVSNTTIQRPPTLAHENRLEAGGLSGKPLKPLSLHALKTLRTLLPASMPLIGCGGISSGADALDYAKAGASAVQLYTFFGYDGVGACRRIKDQILQELKKEGTTWAAITQNALKDLSLKEAKATATAGPTDSPLAVLIAEALDIQRQLEELAERLEFEPKQ